MGKKSKILYEVDNTIPNPQETKGFYIELSRHVTKHGRVDYVLFTSVANHHNNYDKSKQFVDAKTDWEAIEIAVAERRVLQIIREDDSNNIASGAFGVFGYAGEKLNAGDLVCIDERGLVVKHNPNGVDK